MTRRNVLIIALLLSLGLNLFLLGAIGTRMGTVRNFREARPLPPNLSWIIRDLDEARQQELTSLIEPLAAEIIPLRLAMIEAQREVNRLMASSDFDNDAITAAFGDLRAASEAYGARSHEQTITILSELTEAERQAATNFVRRRGPRDGFSDFSSPGGRGQDGFRPPRPDGFRDGGRPPRGDRPPGPDDAPPPN